MKSKLAAEAEVEAASLREEDARRGRVVQERESHLKALAEEEETARRNGTEQEVTCAPFQPLTGSSAAAARVRVGVLS